MTAQRVSAPFCCAFKARINLRCVTSTLADHGQRQALLFAVDPHFIRLDISFAPSNSVSPVVSLGEKVPIRVREPPHLVPPNPEAQQNVFDACWDAYSGSVYAIMGDAVVRVSEDGDATVVAGHPTARGRGDGEGLLARFQFCTCITADEEGCLYVLETGRLRRLQLPAAWRAAQPGAADAAAATEAAPQGGSEQQQQQGQQRQRQQGQRGTGSGPAAEQVQVATILVGVVLRTVAHDPASRSLVLCSDTTVYRLPVEGLGAAAAGAAREPVLLAGSEVDEEGELRDGVGPEARFGNIVGVAVDGTGTAWVLEYFIRGLLHRAQPDGSDDSDDENLNEGTRLRRVDPSGRVETVPAGPLRWHKH